jgi:hypothetical protein
LINWAGWPQTYDPPPFVFPVLKSQVCTTTSARRIDFRNGDNIVKVQLRIIVCLLFNTFLTDKANYNLNERNRKHAESRDLKGTRQGSLWVGMGHWESIHISYDGRKKVPSSCEV